MQMLSVACTFGEQAASQCVTLYESTTQTAPTITDSSETGSHLREKMTVFAF